MTSIRWLVVWGSPPLVGRPTVDRPGPPAGSRVPRDRSRRCRRRWASGRPDGCACAIGASMPARPRRAAEHGPQPTAGRTVAAAGWCGARSMTPRCARPVGPWTTMLFDGVSPPAPRPRPRGDRGVARRLRRRRPGPRAQPGPLPPDAGPRAGPPVPGRLPGHRVDALRQHHPLRRRARVPRGRVPRAADPGLHPVERRGHGGAGQHPLRGHRRAPVHLRQLGRPLRGGLQPLLPGQGRRAAPATRSTSRVTPRPASTPGPSSRAGSPRSNSTTSASRWAADGLSSYPHPRLMPDFWEYPTVSMGLGPLNAIAQAHLARYLDARGLVDTSNSRVWGFVGDGEFDEPETIGALGHGRAGAPRQPDLRRQLQPPAARRPGARQRQDHPGVRGHLPGGRAGT